MATFKVRSNLFVDGVSVVSGEKDVTDTLRISLSESVDTGQTDKQIAVTIDEDALKAFWLSSTQNVTVETNSGSAAQETFALVAGVPVIWTGTGTKPISDDVTGLFVTNASGATATITLEALVDPTP